jgi:hypothetical protein
MTPVFHKDNNSHAGIVFGGESNEPGVIQKPICQGRYPTTGYTNDLGGARFARNLNIGKPRSPASSSGRVYHPRKTPHKKAHVVFRNWQLSPNGRRKRL